MKLQFADRRSLFAFRKKKRHTEVRRLINQNLNY